MLHHENQLPEDHEGRYVDALCDTCGAECRSNTRNGATLSPHISHCHQCYDGLCENCDGCCGICDLHFCDAHLTTCLECGERVCAACKTGNLCRDCIEAAQPQPEITEDAERFLSGVLFCCSLAIIGVIVGYIFSINQ